MSSIELGPVTSDTAVAMLREAHVQGRNFAYSEPFTSLGHFSLGPVDVGALYAEAIALTEAGAGLSERLFVALGQPDSLGTKYPHLVDAYTRISETEVGSRDGDADRIIIGVRGTNKYLHEPVADELVPLTARPHIDMVPITKLEGVVVPLYTTYIVCDTVPTLTFPQEHSAGIDMGVVDQPEGVLLCKPPYPLEESIDRLAAVSDVSHPVPIAAGELNGIMGLHAASDTEFPVERTIVTLEVRRCSTDLYNQVLGYAQQLGRL